MSKRRKQPSKGKSAGGRVTPKGTRPGASAGGSSGRGSAAGRPVGSAADQQFAGTGFDIGPGGSFGDGAFDGLDLDGFDLGIDSDQRADGDPFGPMIEGFRELELSDPLQVELWASELVGEFQAELRQAALVQDGGWAGEDQDDLPSEEEFFYDFVGGISRRFSDAEPEWAELLAAITPFLVGSAKSKAQLDLEAVDPAIVAFAAPVGHAVVESAFLLDHEMDDGHHVALVARHPGAAEPFLVMTFIDRNLGGMAKDVLVAAEVDEVRAEALSQGLVASPLDLAEAHARLQAALGRTDMTMMAPVDDDFAAGRPLLESVMASLPEPSRVTEPVLPGEDELADIVDALVEGSAGALDDELTPDRLRDTATLVTRFMTEQLGRPPVAWSPARLEILLLDFVPRKVPVPAEALASLPAELAALVPAAQRLAGWEDRYLTGTLAAIDRAEPEFLELIASPDAWEPTKRVVLRAIEEEVDLDDPEQVAALIERIRDEGGAGGAGGAAGAGDTAG